MHKVGIIIVNYNGLEYQNECLRSLYNMDYLDFDVIVVDSNSSDNSIDVLREEFPQTIILEQDENVGVVRGNNIGITYALEHGNEYVLLMNNDVVLDSKMLGNMIRYATENVIVVPKIYYYDPPNVLWFAGGKMDWKKITGIHYGENTVDNGEYDEEKSITYAPTCCMLIHRNVFDKVGLGDEKYFMYFDDTDLCARMIEEKYVIKYVPTAYMWHKVSSSTGGPKSKLSTYYNNRNKLYFATKFKHKIKFPYLIWAYMYGIGKFVISPIYKRYNREIIYSYLDYFKGKMYRRN